MPVSHFEWFFFRKNQSLLEQVCYFDLVQESITRMNMRLPVFPLHDLYRKFAGKVPRRFEFLPLQRGIEFGVSLV
jgi:hypothetical protein